YIGWLMHRTLGGIIAGGLFVVPGIIAIMGLSYIYAGWGNVPIIAALFFGLKAAVLAIVVEAVVRIGRRALKNQVLLGLAAAAFVGIFFLNVAFHRGALARSRVVVAATVPLRSPAGNPLSIVCWVTSCPGTHTPP